MIEGVAQEAGRQTMRRILVGTAIALVAGVCIGAALVFIIR
jgi:ABC-type nitrate/sulfonate/bicarbonate transport system permease component